MPLATETSLAMNIKSRRAEIDTNQQAFADQIDVRFSTLREIEEGIIINPPKSVLKRIAKGLRCKVEDLLT